MISIGVKELLESGVHFGHQTKRWNPKMKQFIFDSRNGIHIIDLSKTLKQLETACDFLASTCRKGGQERLSPRCVTTEKSLGRKVRTGARAGTLESGNSQSDGIAANHCPACLPLEGDQDRPHG